MMVTLPAEIRQTPRRKTGGVFSAKKPAHCKGHFFSFFFIIIIFSYLKWGQSEVSQKDKDHYNILTHIHGI